MSVRRASRREREWIDLAQSEARKSPMRSRHGAIAVRRNKVLGIGHNKYTSTKYALHAEKSCCKDVGDLRQLCGATIYIVRDSEHRLSAPCRKCGKLLRRLANKFKLKRVFFTVTDDSGYTSLGEFVL
jgi:pyrimidine deaminase RibD-like protein